MNETHVMQPELGFENAGEVQPDLPVASVLPDTAPPRDMVHIAADSLPCGEVGLLPDKLYFKIGEVARLIGVEPYVLRYWETEFPQIKPAKSQAKQRLYKKQDVETITAIHDLLYNQRFTISGARQQLKTRGKIARVNTSAENRFAAGDGVAPLPMTDTAVFPAVAITDALPQGKAVELRAIIGEMDEFLAE